MKGKIISAGHICIDITPRIFRRDPIQEHR